MKDCKTCRHYGYEDNYEPLITDEDKIVARLEKLKGNSGCNYHRNNTINECIHEIRQYFSEMRGQILYWEPVTEDTEFKDHDWYLLATTKYGTAVKAKFHNDVNHFEILTQSSPEYVYSWEWEGYITHYMEMPKLPWEKELNNADTD